MGHKTVNPINEKLSESVLFLLKNIKTPNTGLKKIAKLLYFADFNFYKKTYHSITNENYCRWERGPFPKNLYDSLEELENKGFISVKDVDHSEEIKGKDITIIKDFGLKYLLKEEQEEILRVIKKIGALSGTQLEKLSHNDTPWQVTDENDVISYDLVFYRNQETAQKVE